MSYQACAIHPLSAHQRSRLMKGQGVTIKPGGSSSIPLDMHQMKKYERAKRLGKGMVLNAHPHQIGMMGQSVESMFRDTGKYLQPVFDAAQDRAIHEMGRGIPDGRYFMAEPAVMPDYRPIVRKGKSVESMFRDTGAYLRPVADAGMDRAIREIGRGRRGGSFESVMRDTGAYLRPVVDAGMDRAIREIGRGFDAEAFNATMNKGIKDIRKAARAKKEGAGKRGRNIFKDMERGFQQTFAPVADVFRPGGSGEQLGKEVAKELIYKGIPGTTGALAGAAGAALQPGNPLTPILFGVAGERAGEELAKEVGRQTGYGRRGRGLMQDAFAMAKTKGKAMAKQAVSKAKTKVKEMVNQYLDLGEKEAMDRIGSGGMGSRKKKFGGGRRGRALLVA